MKSKLDVIDNLVYERKLYDEGYNLIAGIDEVGRGPLAGPVVASCVIMPKGSHIEGVTDSKKVSPVKRKKLKELILEEAIAVSTVFIDEETIDKINIYEASRQAMLKCLENIEISPDYVLVDAMPLNIEIPHQSIIKGDELSYSIACASIIAKEARDDYMDQLDEIYPQYGFKQNKGYPTLKHRNALKEFGITKVHRKTYGPVKKILESLNKE